MDILKHYINEEEIWKQHPIFANYEGSSFGRIRRKETQKIKKPFTNSNGRFLIQIFKNGQRFLVYVHRFICECFYGINNDLTVDHIDSNPSNNHLSNLQYTTLKVNVNNQNSKNKRQPSKTTSKHERVKCFDLNGNFIKTFNSAKEAVSELHLSTNKHASNFITNVCCGLAKSAYGYKWEYANDDILIEGEIFKKHPFLDVEVSNLGRIRKKIFGRYRISLGTMNSFGYLKTSINNKGYFVHRLVAETFIPNPRNKKEINHINANKQDNRIENLEWVTHEENMNSEVTVKNSRAFKVDLYNLKNEYIETFPSLSKMCKKMGFDLKSVRMCLKGEHKQHHGYFFKLHENNKK